MASAGERCARAGRLRRGGAGGRACRRRRAAAERRGPTRDKVLLRADEIVYDVNKPVVAAPTAMSRSTTATASCWPTSVTYNQKTDTVTAERPRQRAGAGRQRRLCRSCRR